ncbi:hypothetical protein AGMMS49587_16580 [Spirochaetia bacterium]|nr:hypothetical protein AGMMS49587_16580 [Spirochaetia bacterium]
MLAIKTKDAYRALMADIINRAMLDVKGGILETAQREKDRNRAKDEAMAWFYSPDFEALSLALEIDPQRIQDKAADFYRQSIGDLLTLPIPRPKSRRRIIVKAKGRSPHNTREAGRTAKSPRK